MDGYNCRCSRYPCSRFTGHYQGDRGRRPYRSRDIGVCPEIGTGISEICPQDYLL